MENVRIYCRTCLDFGFLDSGKICPDCPECEEGSSLTPEQEQEWLSKIASPFSEAGLFCLLMATGIREEARA